jgi:predicted Zn-ribbon and HTH transcriptional regulator
MIDIDFDPGELVDIWCPHCGFAFASTDDVEHIATCPACGAAFAY